MEYNISTTLNQRLSLARERRRTKVGSVAIPEKTLRLDQEKAINKSTTKNRKQRKLKAPPTKSLAIATKQLASMVRTGLPIVEALNLVAETSDHKSIRVAFKDVSDGIGRGNTVVDMLELHFLVFDEMYIALADAGEQAGLLAEVLEREANLLETLAKLQGQIKSAMTYPIAISILVVIVVTIMLLFVIPVFADMYKSSNAALPALTQALIDASNWLKNGENVVILLGGLGVGYLVLNEALKKEKVIRTLDKIILNIPVVGDLTTKSNLANFARTLASLSTAGVPLLEAILIARRTLSNSVFREIVGNMHQSIRVGDPIYKSLSASERVPKMFSAMFRIGEQTGELGGMVDKLADFYEEEVSTAVKSLTSILEPMMIVVVAGVVAVILVAMYLPMFNMMNTIK